MSSGVPPTTDNDGSIALYSYWRSSCSWRVRIALNIKKVDYQYREVHLLFNGGAQRQKEFKEKVNPMMQIPTLFIDGISLSQSVAIIEYLEETRSGVALFPKDPFKRALVRTMVEIINSGIQPLQNLAFLQKLEALGGDKDAHAKDVIIRGFEALEATLVSVKDRKAGDYCVGSEVTAADLFLVPQVYNARRYNVDLALYPTIADIESRLSELDEFKQAHPSNQPDCPPAERGTR